MTEATAKVVNCILAVDIIYLKSKRVELVCVEELRIEFSC